MSTITHKGAAYPVTDAWHAENTEPWPEFAEMEFEQTEALRLGLLDKANARGGITQAEYDKLQALQKHSNVRNCLTIMDGRPHTDFGFTGVDQLHFNFSHKRCGCVLQHAIDHHVLVGNTLGKLVLTPHRPGRVCERHAHLNAHPWVNLHAQVEADHAAAERAPETQPAGT